MLGIAKWSAAVIGLTLAVGASASVSVEPSYLTLSYTQPSGTVTATENIDISITLTLSQESPSALIYRGSSWAEPSFDLPDGWLPAVGQYLAYNPLGTHSEFASYDRVDFRIAAQCLGSILGDACNNGAYVVLGNGNIPNALNLMPGESVSVTALTLAPKPGIAPGTYTQTGFVLYMDVYGKDVDGNELFASPDIVRQQDITFSRTVTAVPEAESAAMALSGLVALGAVGMRRKTRAK